MGMTRYFFSSFDDVSACFPMHICEPHMLFMQKVINLRD